MHIIKIIISFAVGILIGWYLHFYNSESGSGKSTKTVIEKPIYKSEVSSEKNEKDIPKKIDKQISKNNDQFLADTPKEYTKPKRPSEFEKLLKNGLFEDAMAIYMDADEDGVVGYKIILMKYFSEARGHSYDKRIDELLQYIDIEPEFREPRYLLINLYMKKKEYLKAIDQIKILKEDYVNEEEDEKLDSLLKTAADSYINVLQKSKSYDDLIVFLQSTIESGLYKSYYSLELAKLYFDLQKYDESETLLDGLKDDATYGNQAKNILDKIKKLEAEAKEYEYKIPLQRSGGHFVVQATVNDSYTLNLLLDTGATYTLISKDKLFSPVILKSNITLRTAGGEIDAKLCRINSFALDGIELSNFKVMSAQFSQNGIDGLLGMNFFKKFKFFIDQKNALLYLSKK